MTEPLLKTKIEPQIEGDKLPVKKCGTCGRVYSTAKDFLTGTKTWRLSYREDLFFTCGCDSTLMLPKGMYDWYRPELLMSQNSASIFERLSLGEKIPRFSQNRIEIQNSIRDPRNDAKTVARIIKGDPILAADILKLTGGIAKGRRAKIKGLEHAISYIGRRVLSDLVVASSIGQFPLDCKVFSADEYWKKAMITGLIASKICEDFVPEVDKDTTYIYGSLVNIGKLMQAICFPSEADHIVLLSNEKLIPWRKAEAELKCPEHTVLGEIASVFWALPDMVRDLAINHHQFIEEKPENKSVKIGIQRAVALASQLTHWVSDEPHQMEESLCQKTAASFGLDTGAKLDEYVSQFFSLAEMDFKFSK